MLQKVLESLKKFFTGACIDDELEEFIKSHNPTTMQEEEQLKKIFWDRKCKKYGY